MREFTWSVQFIIYYSFARMSQTALIYHVFPSLVLRVRMSQCSENKHFLPRANQLVRAYWRRSKGQLIWQHVGVSRQT